ncbi:MAG: LysR family transcriptional regulator [Sphingobium sp.]|nr:LysR family transcriptional regulator [Sphingobium sp.]
MPTDTPPLVPLRHRADGWTPRRQCAFLLVLKQTRSVTRAARAVGLSRAAAYRLRGHPAAHDFAIAWDAAMQWPRPS